MKHELNLQEENKLKVLTHVKAKMLEANEREQECYRVYQIIAAFVEENEGKKITKKVLKDICHLLPEYIRNVEFDKDFPETYGKLRYAVHFSFVELQVQFGQNFDDSWKFQLAWDSDKTFSLERFEKMNVWASQPAMKRIQKREQFLETIESQIEVLFAQISIIRQAADILTDVRSQACYFPKEFSDFLSEFGTLTYKM